MNHHFEDLALRLPELRAFADDIAVGLVSGQHALIRTNGTGAGLALYRRALDEALERRRGPSLSAVPLADQRLGEAPDEFLGRLSSESSRRFAAPTAPTALAVQEIFWLDGTHDSAELANGWYHYLHALGRRSAPTDFAVACAIQARAPGDPEIANGATWLRVARWCPRASSLGWRLLARLGSDDNDIPATLWREAVLPELAGPHPELVGGLWDLVLGQEPPLHQALSAHGAALGLDAATLRGEIGDARRSRSAGAWATLLARGAAQDTLEHGIEPTATALSVSGELEGVRHRLWRGAATLLLPWLASLRHHLCERLARRHGARWAIDLAPRCLDQEDRKRFERDPLAVEFPAVWTALHVTRATSELLSFTREAWLVRNDIAHCQPVAFSRFEALHRRLPLVGS